MSAGPEEIAEAVERLRAGRLVAFPTETVYGLGARALDPIAVERVFAVKGRPSSNPLIVHVSSERMAQTVAQEWPHAAHVLSHRFWPGPLSLVVPKRAEVPDAVTAGGPTVAIRAPAHPLTLALIETLGEPIVGPSANRSGHISPTTAAHVRDSFPGDDVLVLDGGPCSRGIESTVVDVTSTPVHVLRKGVITPAEIFETLGRHAAESRDTGGRFPAHSDIARSPGMLASHYAPRARAVLVTRDELTASLADGGGAVVAIVHSDIRPPFHTLRLANDPEAYAAEIYAALRDADARNPDLIAIERPPVGSTRRERELWEAILDRLSRACADRP